MFYLDWEFWDWYDPLVHCSHVTGVVDVLIVLYPAEQTRIYKRSPMNLQYFNTDHLSLNLLHIKKVQAKVSLLVCVIELSKDPIA